MTNNRDTNPVISQKICTFSDSKLSLISYHSACLEIVDMLVHASIDEFVVQPLLY